MSKPPGISSDNFHKALHYAIERLAFRDHGCKELALKLQRKGFDEQAACKAIAACEDRGYLNDRRYAANIAAIQQRRGFGLSRIRAVLKSKGIDSAIIEHALAQQCSNQEQIKAARIALNRKIRRLKAGSQQDQRPKLWNYLYGRGFSTAVITEVLKDMSPAEFQGPNWG